MTVDTLGSGDFVDEPVDGSTSDGFHTFDELYEHRTALFALLCRLFPSMAWRSREHHPEDLPMYAGFFVAGLNLPIKGTIRPATYHCLLERWDDFEGVPELEHAPRWDGHTPADVLERINAWWRLTS